MKKALSVAVTSLALIGTAAFVASAKESAILDFLRPFSTM